MTSQSYDPKSYVSKIDVSKRDDSKRYAPISTDLGAPRDSLPPVQESASRPVTLSETGLSEPLVMGLLLKQLSAGGVLTKEQMVNRLALAGGIIQSLLSSAKKLGWIENRQSASNGQMRYALSHLGEEQAQQAYLRSGYRGIAPVPLEQYLPLCRQQSSRATPVSLDMLKTAFADLILPDKLIEQIGPALNSSRPLLIYGPAGTGKSYLCRHLNLVFGDAVLIPYAISIGSEIIQVFDPELHHPVQTTPGRSLRLNQGHDPRWIKCQRPLRITGGELTAEMLEVQYDANSRTYMAPLQLKANNGILLLDDLGRQRISAKQLFNRWIIPLEERRDFLALQSGEHFEIPFELLLLFSTNLSPSELVDDAFLRRLGYKIHLRAYNEADYRKVWFQQCQSLQLSCSEALFQSLIADFHQRDQRPMVPCYPRDLLGIITDHIKFMGLKAEVTPELLREAWNIYFVQEH